MFLGRYEVIRKIGSGGFGEVLLARSIGAEGFERIVALKRLRGDLARRVGSLKGIINEARIGGLLNHPNIVQVLEFIQIGPDYLLVMEYIDGIPLQEILERQNDSLRLLTPGLALDIVIQTCDGLHYAHNARSITGVPLKLVHRDIKPSNLMVMRTGTVKIMDFGVARSVTNMGHSSIGTIKGTLRYLSPEQAEGSREIGHTSDLFSLGLVLCEMIIGHPVYEADQEHLVLLRALQAQTGTAIQEADALVPGLGSVLQRCLTSEPEGRFPTAEALAQALRRLKKDFPVGSGLPAMVDRALALRDKAASHEEPAETTFSLELRRKGMDRRAPVVDYRPIENIHDELHPKRPPAPPRDAEPKPLPEVAEEAWEWEWRMTTYPVSRSELDEGYKDDPAFHGRAEERFPSSRSVRAVSLVSVQAEASEEALSDSVTEVEAPAPTLESNEVPPTSIPQEQSEPSGDMPEKLPALQLPAEGEAQPEPEDAEPSFTPTSPPPTSVVHIERDAPEPKAKDRTSASVTKRVVIGLLAALGLVLAGFLLGVEYATKQPTADRVLAPSIRRLQP